MPEKDTQSLEHDLPEAEDFEPFLTENEASLRESTLAEYLQKLLAEKHLVQADIISASGLEPKYADHIFAGRKKHTSRAKALSIALAMGLTPKEAQYLLYYAGAERLYVRNPWDSVIWYALEHRMTVMETNLLLRRVGKQPLLGRVEE